MRARFPIATLLRSALLLFVLVGVTRAADVVIDDLRVEYSPVLGHKWLISGQLDDDAPGTSGDLHGNFGRSQTIPAHTRRGLAYYRSLGTLEADRGAFLLGLSGNYDQLRTVYSSRATTWMVDGFAGFAWAFTPSWHIEQGIIVGAGRARWQFNFPGWYFDGTDWTPEDSVLTYEYGARIGTTYTLARHVVAVLDARYLVDNARASLSGSHSFGGATETVTWSPRLRIEGLGATLSLGWRF